MYTPVGWLLVHVVSPTGEEKITRLDADNFQHQHTSTAFSEFKIKIKNEKSRLHEQIF
jgi:hypothetical protein